MLHLLHILLDLLPQDQLQASKGLVIRVEGIDPRWHTHKSDLPLFAASLQLMVGIHRGLRYFHQVQSLKVMLCPSIYSMMSPPDILHVMLTLHGNQRFQWLHSYQLDFPA